MTRSFLDRILPKERPVKIDLPPIEHRRDLTVAYAAIVRAVGAGELAPGEGSAVAALLTAAVLSDPFDTGDTSDCGECSLWVQTHHFSKCVSA
jgi:hypothetical protein